MIRPVVVVAVVLVAGCSTYSVRRAALVPNLQPTQRSGQPLGDNLGEVSAGTANLVTYSEYREVDGANAGVAIPRNQVHAAGRLRVTPDLDIGLLWDHGFDEGSIKVSDDQPDPKNGDVFGAGISVHHSAPSPNPDFRIALAAELMSYSVPWVEYRTCATNCLGERFTIVKRERSSVPVLSLAVIPSLRASDSLTVFGGVTMRNHPTIPRSSIEGPLSGDEGKVRAGPFNYIASAGVELATSFGPRFMLLLYQPLYAHPVHYGPTVGVNVTLPFGVAAAAPAPAYASGP